MHGISEHPVLRDWEDRLAPYFEIITLLGEIPITESDLEEIRQAAIEPIIKISIGGFQLRQSSVNYLSSLYPRVFVTYLAALAARNEFKRYWDVVASSLGANNADSTLYSAWGKEFIEIIREFGLPDFSDVGGYKYVTPIRLHGGIPAYSLPDFFKHILLPWTEKERYLGLNSRELIHRLENDKNLQIAVDSPVTNFLVHGGEVSEQFLKACRDMALAWKKEKTIPSAQTLKLPPYVVQAFKDYMTGRLTTPTGKRLRQPILLLEPFSPSELYLLELPRQPVDIERASWSYEWELTAIPDDDGEQIVSTEGVRVRRVGYDLFTQDKEISLELPPSQVEIAFVARPRARDNSEQTEILGHWTLQLTPTHETVPLLAFSPPKGHAVAIGAPLPPRELWILLPRSAKLDFAGQPRKTENFPDLVGSWEDWKLEGWDLTHVKQVTVREAGSNRILGLPISVQGKREKPQIIHDHPLLSHRDPDHIPVFVGAPPILKIPRMKIDEAEDLRSWELRIKPIWAAEPDMFIADYRSLVHWKEKLTIRNEEICMPLDAILGRQAAGTYQLDVKTRYQQPQTLTFRIWPKLKIEGLQSYYLPNQQGHPMPARFLITTHSKSSIDIQSGAEGVRLAALSQPGSYEVVIDENVTEVPLFLIWPRVENDPVRMQLYMAVPRLRWLIYVDGETSEWMIQAGEWSVNRILQAQNAQIVFELDTFEENSHTWKLLLFSDHDNSPLPIQETEFTFRSGYSRVSVALGQFYDTIQSFSEDPTFTLALSTETNVKPIPLLSLVRQIDVDVALFEWIEPGVVRLHWESPYYLKNRRVQIWSAWRPWVPPLEIPIPDDAKKTILSDKPGSGVLDIQSDLSPGWYYVRFYTSPPWTSYDPPRAPSEDSLLLKDFPYEKRINQLTTSDTPDTFETHFERACIYDTLNLASMCNTEIQWLFHHLDSAPYELIPAFYRWLGEHNPQDQKAVRMKLFSPSTLKRFFQSEPPPNIRREYLDIFPQTDFVKTESAEIILANDTDPIVIAHALSILIERKPLVAIRYMVEQIDKGAFGDWDALNVLDKVPIDDAFAQLKQLPSGPTRNRLMLSLAERMPESPIIKPGFWMRTKAGWARIDQVLQGEEEVSAILTDSPNILIHATLRPIYDDIQILVDLQKKTLTFKTEEEIYECTKDTCHGFYTNDLNLLMEKHNHAAHLGLGPSYRPLRKLSFGYQIRFRDPVIVQGSRPENILI